MDRQRLALLLIVIFLFAGLLVYFGVEGFAQYKSYKDFDVAKRGSSTLCDPCFDPNCKTDYPVSQQECNNPDRIVVTRGDTPTVNGVMAADSGSGSGSSQPAPLPAAITPNAAASLAAAANTIKSVLGTSDPTPVPLKGTTQPSDPDMVTMSATDFYDYLRPQILKTVTDVMNKTPATDSSGTPGLSASSLPNVMPAALGTSKGAAHTPAGAQGEDYSNCKPFNKNEWIRKDSIPCYACTL